MCSNKHLKKDTFLLLPITAKTEQQECHRQREYDVRSEQDIFPDKFTKIFYNSDTSKGMRCQIYFLRLFALDIYTDLWYNN